MKKFFIFLGLILLGYLGYRNYFLNKQLSTLSSGTGLDMIGKRISWPSGQAKVTSFANMFLGANLPFDIPVYVEFDTTDARMLTSFLESSKLTDENDGKLRAYYALETKNLLRPVLTLVFVPADKVNDKFYSENPNCCVYNLGVPCPPDCSKGRLTSTNPWTAKGAVMALKAYGNSLPKCVSRPPGLGIPNCINAWPVSIEPCVPCSQP